MHVRCGSVIYCFATCKTETERYKRVAWDKSQGVRYLHLLPDQVRGRGREGRDTRQDKLGATPKSGQLSVMLICVCLVVVST